jgi:hypothetical protein
MYIYEYKQLTPEPNCVVNCKHHKGYMDIYVYIYIYIYLDIHIYTYIYYVSIYICIYKNRSICYLCQTV